ncbi:hypothetical protein TWF718_009934 [Orbilia javanica]|uniref:Uncharacterized protein n=1 Tax=Orbilia javanica TaxID=47235 RepID=A0AAN8RFE5_9PEZI
MHLYQDIADHFKNLDLWLEWECVRVTPLSFGRKNASLARLYGSKPLDQAYLNAVNSVDGSPPMPSDSLAYQILVSDVYKICVDKSKDLSSMLRGRRRVIIPREPKGYPTRFFLNTHREMCAIAARVRAEEQAEALMVEPEITESESAPDEASTGTSQHLQDPSSNT